MTEAAYPLSWPKGWPRTPSRRDGYQFYIKGNSWGRNPPPFDKSRRQLFDELEKLGAKYITLSTNVPLRADGVPHATARSAASADPGVAVYFTLKGRPIVMAQDTYNDVACNLRSLTLAIEAMRALERHGGGTMMNKAFDGFAALPPPEGSRPARPWWEVLHYPADPADREFLTAAEVEARYRGLAKRYHPDAGGDPALFAELATARDMAVEELGS